MRHRFATVVGIVCLLVLFLAAVGQWQRLNDPVRRLGGFIALPNAADEATLAPVPSGASTGTPPTTECCPGGSG